MQGETWLAQGGKGFRNDTIKISAKEGCTYSEILKNMKTMVNPMEVGMELLCMRRVRRDELFVVLIKVETTKDFKEALTKAIGNRTEVAKY